jgi:hypothetical protein
MLLTVLNAIHMSVCLNKFVMDDTFLPKYIIVAQFVGWLVVMVMAVLDLAGIGGVMLIGSSDVVDDRGFILFVFGDYEVCCISVVYE